MITKAEEVAPVHVPKKQMTTRQWAEAETLYALGETTLTEIATKFGATPQTVSQHMKRKGVKRGSKAEEHAKRVKAEVEKSAIGDAAVMAARIRETKEDHYKMSSGLAKLTWAEVLKAKSDGSPFSVAAGNLKALDLAMGVLKKAREERFAILGLDRTDFVDEDGLPELVISELTADQVLALQERDNDFDDIQTDDVVQIEGEDDVREDDE